ncbi:double-strand break repair helicase AddA [Sulfitobacter mediterraneus]|uniref:double-strand break repair helicase AddA n=1 Tax=Sulfitobacter mediterraneus TaxID=83219 RepID=UPI001939BF94|nr:double-strand break repair helicase AddA [Sulfitobacter mediterraneus]MBM1555358.1 double-strand break repair helicase AddA [Sulfitobacter mediterraneus]MBM1567089.1 double-strand break repair helicase AddA [Sulfitobacter mediterraneus]MBM1570891.1 double-strand break repair helicase AddA [Sulfitobacter mediterraneus]MBM1574691.1 double-strand break repair helicase AddA [Sulfitobacter mediterraneus]MBM1578316.1 double-strand break repair helicase AddA [Sulfitobacter mediterraneus]
MKPDFDDATRAQIDAARPDASTWLAANAGSGKTRVLTDRVARLLLSGVEPQHILCLTYTKAAASEMQNRLFKRLGEWAMLDDAALRKAMADLGLSGDLDPAELRKARTLFALAIEAPGGLKIQTIHSFCASLLRRFPLEAGVSPQFSEIEDRAADLLRADIVDSMAEDHDAPLIAEIARFYTGEDFGKLTRSIVGLRDAFAATPDWAELLQLLDQKPDLSRATIEQSVFLGSEADLIKDITPHLIAKGGNDTKAGDLLAQIESFDLSSLPTLESVFLTGASAKAPFTAKTGSFPTKPTQKIIADAMPALEQLMMRVEEAREARLAFALAQKTHALHRFASAFLSRYEAAKQARGWLDFDDLILKARALLTDKAVAAWVLFRIDGGIDHILVDEAQDTSPRQWDVIERLTDEFYSGSGARSDVERTLFVVGDKKQSIYSFQGADPLEFDRKSLMFEEKIAEAGKIFQHRSLDYSFRSSSAILRLVDTAFDPDIQPGLDQKTQHKPFKSALPGRADLWPVVEKADDDEDRVWTDPVDRRSARHHTVLLAEQIAARIAALIQEEHFIPEDSDPPGVFARRRIRAGDFLILVQRRSALFSEIIRACKAANLPIAGADRLKVGAELAVKDLAALLSFLATPDDDLSLATALKSPLFGWSEQMLFDLAHRRSERHLWQALRNREDHAETVSKLEDLRARVDFLRPYDLIECILTRHDGRRKLLSRLGAEAEDGINAMLSQALSYERSNVPSLTGFIVWMQTDDLEIKRQIDSASDQIRVMTVHGAKGLEAPIVILPDTGRRDITIKDEIVRMQGVPIWKAAAADMPTPLRETIDGMKDAQFQERLRLLYVAMTRAEKWLIVAAAGDLSKDGSSWYQIAQTAMGHANAVPVGSDGTLRFAEGDWDGLAQVEHIKKSVEKPLLDPVFSAPAPIYALQQSTLSPSDLGGAKALPGDAGEDKESAMLYGTLVHDLLEKLAPIAEAERAAVAAQLISANTSEMAERAMQEAVQVLSTPALAHIFAHDTLAEVPITAQIRQSRLHGVIDRLIITANTVTAVDFKTNRTVPNSVEQCPDGILRQMGAYAQMLGQIYPDHEIRTAILWTSASRLMELPHNIVTSALECSPYLDAEDMRS